MAAPARTVPRPPYGSLAHAWHPVALSRELLPGGWLQVRLLGRTWSLHRGDDGLAAAPPAFDVGERYGMVWLAPAEPRSRPLEVPEADDRRFVVRSLAPVRAPGPAGLLLERLLEEECDGDPFRTTTVVGAPFCLARRVEDPATGASTTVVVVLQPEDDDSTRAYGLVLLSAGPGRHLPSPATAAQVAAAAQRMLTPA
jgi:hypothetical protein